MELIDLHTHTTASDGSLTPSQLVAAAKEAGLKAVAITDHDNISGLEEALAAGAELGLEVIPGVEISVEGEQKGGIHVVGLFLDHRRAALGEGLERLQQARAQRNPQIAARLQELGMDITMEQVLQYAGRGQVGRPHFAQALIEGGYVQNRQEAFGRFLAADKPAYVPKFRFSPPEALSLLRGAGAVPILAHPGLLNLPWAELEALLRQLIGQGLEGLEAYYSEHDQATTQRLVSLAARLGLVVSGGSDFHGLPKPDISLGRGKGDMRIPYSLLTALKQRAAKVRAEAG
ncbi:MAG: PHP domain-containing protein [Desulfarculaceae bacterium]|jgi:predicted metal-dependent phosphoesterase TrpH